MKLGKYITPTKFRFAKKKYKGKKINILDVGCFNSPSLTKHWFPNSEYHGLDISDERMSNEDKKKIEKFFLVSPNGLDGYDQIEDNYYDFIVMNHVIEHVKDQDQIIKSVCKKLKVGGIIWIAFPSPKSINFPSAKGTLNFYDDPTHISITSTDFVSSRLKENNIVIIRSGKSNDFIRYIIGIFIFPLAKISQLI